jgi:hypothetical protein
VKALERIYEFVTGGSIAAPIGVAAALLLGHFGARVLTPPLLAGAFFAVLVLTFAASTVERAR